MNDSAFVPDLDGTFTDLDAYALIVDTDVCLGAPAPLWCSGVGDLVAKLTAVRDWKLAFHARGTPVNDLAALMSDASVFQFIASPTRDPEGIRFLATCPN